MANRVEVAAAAQNDLEAMLRYYREVSPASVERLESELRAIHLRISTMPYSYQAYNKGIRRAHLATFPYTLYYRVGELDLEIAAVLPQRIGITSLSSRLHSLPA